MAEEVKKVKRPEKKSTINFIMSQYACLKAGIPGVSMESVVAQMQYGNYYLYKAEVEAIVEAQVAENAEFDTALFVEILEKADAIKAGATPRLTDTLVRVNSQERALQVANNPANEVEVATIVEGMTKIKAIQAEIEPLLNEKASISVALKNKKPKVKKEKGVEEETV